jgi:hypothetical protein
MKKLLLLTSLVFALNKAIAQDALLSVLYSFDLYQGGPTSSLLLTDEGILIGHTNDNIYQLIPDTQNYTFKLMQNAGRHSENEGYTFSGDLTFSKDKKFFYGVKNSFTHGAIFKMSIEGNLTEILHETSIKDSYDEGYDLQGGMVISADERFLYGVAESGGRQQPRSTGGVVYRLSLYP